jgi:uncharacterized membrane protein
MPKTRLEAFSDAVIAILITILVLDLKVPHETTLAALQPLIPVFLSYILSFANLAVYWTNHHHLLQAAERVNGRILWANVYLLFWLSLFPFMTGWIAENQFQSTPVAVYGFVLLMASWAYFLLAQALIRENGETSKIAQALGCDHKSRLSMVIYGIAIVASWWLPHLSVVFYFLVAAMWIIPDRRIERVLR